MDKDAIKKTLADGTDKGFKALDAFLEDEDQQRRAEVLLTNAILSFIMRRDTVRSVRAINEIRAGRPITLGYTLTNVVACCSTCNFAKRDRSYDEFLAWVKRVCERRV